MKKIYEKVKTNTSLIFTILSALIIIVSIFLFITGIIFEAPPIIICIMTALFFVSLIYIILE